MWNFFPTGQVMGVPLSWGSCVPGFSWQPGTVQAPNSDRANELLPCEEEETYIPRSYTYHVFPGSKVFTS